MLNVFSNHREFDLSKRKMIFWGEGVVCGGDQTQELLSLRFVTSKHRLKLGEI